MFALSGAAGAGADELQRIITEEYRKVMEQKQMAQAQQALQQQAMRDATTRDLGMGRLDVDRQGLGMQGRRIDLDENQFKEDTRRYGLEQPVRARLQVAQATDIEGRPQREEAARQHTTSRDATLHGYQLREIGAQGAEQRRTVATRQQGAPEQRDLAEEFSTERRTRMRDAIAAIRPNVSRRTAGVGSMLAGVPETGARNLKAQLESLKSNVAFNELQEMRNASKTGGALGQVSDRENAMLAAALGSLDQGQSPDRLVQTLDNIIGVLDRWEAAKAQYGAVPMNSRQGTADANDSNARVDALLKKYGGR